MPTIAAIPSLRPVGAALVRPVPVGAIPAASAVPTGATVALTITSSRDYGHIRYGEANGSPAVNLTAGQKTPFVFTIDPTQTQNYLKAPFAGALSFDGTTITPRALGDGLFVEVNLLVTSAVAGGFLRLEIDVGSTLGPVGGIPVALTMPAGQQERVTFPPIFVQTLGGFMANGGRLYITGTVPVALVSEALILIPHTAAS